MSVLEELYETGQYNPQDWSTETVLAESSVDLLCESIQKQFQKPLEYGTNDFVQAFITKYTLAKKVIEEENDWEDDEVEAIEQYYDRFVSRVLKIFSTYLDIEIPEIENMGHVDQLTMIHYVYLYFVNHMRHNFLNYLSNYMKEKTDSIKSHFKLPKDAGYYNDFITDDYDRLVVMNSIPIAEFAIVDDSVSCEQFLEWTMDEEGDLENEFVLNKYKECEIVGNFKKKYAKMMDDYIVPVACLFQREITVKYHKEYEKISDKEAFERVKKASLEADKKEQEEIEAAKAIAREEVKSEE